MWHLSITKVFLLKSCTFFRVARSKHCSLCGFCVVKSDHHCIWINGCVGYRNHRFFFLFLFVDYLMCLYSFFVILAIFYAEIDRMKLLGRDYIDHDTGERRTVSLTLALLYMATQETLLAGLCLFSGCVALVLLFFLGYHVLLMARGMTSNEVFKWDDLHIGFKHGETIQVPRYMTTEFFHASEKRKTLESHAQDDDDIVTVCNVKHLVNIYNRGWFLNTFDLIFPVSLPSTLSSVSRPHSQ